MKRPKPRATLKEAVDRSEDRAVEYERLAFEEPEIADKMHAAARAERDYNATLSQTVYPQK